MKVSISNVPKIVTLAFLVLGLVALLDLSSVESHSHGSDSHKCNHGHGHDHHHHHDHHAQVTLLPEELAALEDSELFGSGFHDDHDHDDGDDGDDHKDQHFGILQLTGPGVWMHAMGCSFLVSLASLICLIILPVVFVQGKPSKAVVDSLALFGAGAMLGDAFLHQLPHAFGGGHSHDHQEEHNHDHGSSHSQSHAHSLSDLSVGLSVLAGIVIFLLVEKVVRYVEDYSGGSNAWSHGHHHHHHHHHNKSKKLKEDDENDSHEDENPALEKIDEVELLDEEPSDSSNKKLSNIRKRRTANNDKEDKEDAVDANKSSSGNAKSSKEEHAHPQSLVFGYLNLFSDGVHNFTDGMALGSAFLVHGSVGGWSRTLFLLAHEIPQEVGDFGILVRSGFSVSKALFFNFLSALVALAGTALALLWGRDPGQSSLIEGFTAGGFIYIAVAGVLAEMNSNGKTTVKSVAAQLTSLVLGMGVALCISLVE